MIKFNFITILKNEQYYCNGDKRNMKVLYIVQGQRPDGRLGGGGGGGGGRRCWVLVLVQLLVSIPTIHSFKSMSSKRSFESSTKKNAIDYQKIDFIKNT